MKLLALIKKEFYRFFRDPRLIVTMLLPGILIFALYSILGNAIYSEEEEARAYRIYLQGESSLVTVLEEVIKESGDTVEFLPLEDEESAKAEIEEGEAAAILVFPEGFDETLLMGVFGETKPAVRIVYDPSDEASMTFYSIASATLQEIGSRFEIAPQSVRSEPELGREVMTTILPFIIVCFVFSACMSVTLESVAGEKERGTLATVLVTSARRSDVAIGKIVPLACVSMLGALSSFLGIALSMPKLMGMSLGFLGTYSVWSYILLLPLLLCIVPLIVAVIATVSTLSRSVKEASAYTGVLMILVMVVSIITSFVPSFGDWTVVVPVLNAVVYMQRILQGGLPVWQSLVSVGVNLLYTAVLVVIITKMLSSERIMFGK